MKLGQKKIEAVMALTGPKRYSHFIKVVADQRKVWGLFSEGWAMAGTDDGKRAFPLWPAAEYAERCAVQEWSGYTPREIDMDTLFEVLMPKLKQSGDNIAVFPTPAQKGVLPELDVLEVDIRSELSRIE